MLEKLKMSISITAGGLLGSLFGGHGSSHNFGNSGYSPSPGYGGGYGQPSPQVVYVEENKPKRGGGLGAGGGLALGDYSVSYFDPNSVLTRFFHF